jgi:hypothetical protein
MKVPWRVHCTELSRYTSWVIQWAMDFLQTLLQNKYFSYCAYLVSLKVHSVKNYTKRSSNTLLHLVSFFLKQMVVDIYLLLFSFRFCSSLNLIEKSLLLQRKEITRLIIMLLKYNKPFWRTRLKFSHCVEVRPPHAVSVQTWAKNLSETLTLARSLLISKKCSSQIFSLCCC